MKGNRLWLLGTVAVVAVVVLLGWFLGISPKLAEGDAAIVEKSDVDALNQGHEATLVQLREQFENIDDLKVELATMGLEIPSTPEVDAYLATVQAAAAASGVVVKSFSATEPAVYGTIALTDGAAPPPTPEGETAPATGAPDNVYTIGIVIEVIGPADAAIRFSKAMQLGKRLFVAQRFDYLLKENLGTLAGVLYVIDDPNAAAPGAEGESTEEPASESTPAPSETPTPTPTATNG